MKPPNPDAVTARGSLLHNPLLLPLYMPALLLSIAQGMIVPVLPLFANSFDAPYFLIGLVLAGDGMGMLLSDLPAGMILHKLDRRQGMVLGLSLVSLSTLALFWAGSIPLVLLLRILAGAGSALYNVSRHAYISETITVASRGRSVALLGGTFRAGRFIGPVIGGSLAAASGLRAPFLLYAGVCLMAAAAILIFNRQSSPVEAFSSQTREPATFRSIAASLPRLARRIAYPGAGHLFMQMVRAGPQVIIPLYGSQVLGLDVQQIGWIFGAASAVDMTLFYPTGIIMDRLGRKFAIVPSALIMALGLALIPFTGSFLTLTLAAVINGFGNGLGSGVMLTIGADLAPPETRSEFLGIWSLIGDTGMTFSPVVAGSVADLFALQPAAWVIAGSGLAAGMIFALFVPETLKKPQG